MRKRKTKVMEKKSSNSSIILLLLVVVVIGVLIYKNANSQQKTELLQTEFSSKGSQLLENAKKVGKPVFLLFHSSTCIPCQQMEEIVNKVKPDFEKQIVFVDINVYDRSEQELINKFGVQAIPTSVFIGSDGIIRDGQVGVIEEKVLRKILKKLAKGEL